MSKLRPIPHRTALDMPTEVSRPGMTRLSDREFEDFMRRTKLPGEDRYLLVAEARRARESEARLLEVLRGALGALSSVNWSNRSHNVLTIAKAAIAKAEGSET